MFNNKNEKYRVLWMIALGPLVTVLWGLGAWLTDGVCFTWNLFFNDVAMAWPRVQGFWSSWVNWLWMIALLVICVVLGGWIADLNLESTLKGCGIGAGVGVAIPIVLTVFKGVGDLFSHYKLCWYVAAETGTHFFGWFWERVIPILFILSGVFLVLALALLAVAIRVEREEEKQRKLREEAEEQEYQRRLEEEKERRKRLREKEERQRIRQELHIDISEAVEQCKERQHMVPKGLDYVAHQTPVLMQKAEESLADFPALLGRLDAMAEKYGQKGA